MYINCDLRADALTFVVSSVYEISYVGARKARDEWIKNTWGADRYDVG